MPLAVLEVPDRPGIAGVDEVGRGPLAGPVVAAAVILPQGFDPIGLGDSKALTQAQRLTAEKRIRAEASWSIAFVDPDEIDRINILQATFAAMRRALMGLAHEPELAIVDGDKTPPGLPFPSQALIKGDAKHASVAAASILAKCARDRYMMEMAVRFPNYGFERNVGYGSAEHLAAIAKWGPCPLHRMSFAPMRQDSQLCLMLET